MIVVKILREVCYYFIFIISNKESLLSSLTLSILDFIFLTSSIFQFLRTMKKTLSAVSNLKESLMSFDWI